MDLALRACSFGNRLSPTVLSSTEMPAVVFLVFNRPWTVTDKRQLTHMSPEATGLSLANFPSSSVLDLVLLFTRAELQFRLSPAGETSRKRPRNLCLETGAAENWWPVRIFSEHVCRQEWRAGNSPYSFLPKLVVFFICFPPPLLIKNYSQRTQALRNPYS